MPAGKVTLDDLSMKVSSGETIFVLHELSLAESGSHPIDEDLADECGTQDEVLLSRSYQVLQ